MRVAEPRRATITARLALSPIAVGIWLEGEEPSDPDADQKRGGTDGRRNDVT
jgi:hypothetical protein